MPPENNSTEKSPEETLRSNLNVSSLEHTFKNFIVSSDLRTVYKAFRLFAEKLTPPLILCVGDTGNGKSHMLEATAIRLHERGIFARVIPWVRFANALKGAMDGKSQINYDQLLLNYTQARILLIDDYGMGNMDTVWNRSLLEDIIDYRYWNRRPTALTSNLPIVSTPPHPCLPARIVGRFSEPGVGVVIENKAGDYRRRNEG